MIDAEIVDIEVHDIRFPTSMWHVGTDSLHYYCNHACTYVVIHTNTRYKGYGIAATLGKGNDLVVQACKLMGELVKKRTTTEIYTNFASFWRQITNNAELRWLGPECGVVRLATAGIVNALWDLWARIEDKPVWRLLTDMTAEQLVSTIDFKYIRDVVTEEEAIQILRESQELKEEKEKKLQDEGYPSYTADIGWWTFGNQQIRSACKKFKKLNFTNFKASVGRTIPESLKRCILIRQVVGRKMVLLTDANQIWDEEQVTLFAKSTVKSMLNRKKYLGPYCIEDPTSSDDILGYDKIINELAKFGRPEVICGEMCANRILFKQFLKMTEIKYWNINVGRLGGVNEALAVYFMAKKYGITVWGHAGGMGLGEMIQHLQIWDFISLSQSDDAVIEYTSHQHGYFEDPVFIRNSYLLLPNRPGFSTQLKDKCIARWSYPEGTRWKHLFQTKHFKRT